MNQKDYFKQLKDELHGHPFRDRFLEELEDHADDIKNDKELKEKFIESEMIKKYLGEPKEVKESFLNIMHPFRRLFFVLEGLFFSIFLIPVSILTHQLLRQIFLPGEFGTPSLIYILGSFLSILGIFFVLYILAFKHLSELNIFNSKKIFFWLVSLITPSLLVFIILLFSEEPYLKNSIFGIFWLVASYLMINLIASFLGWIIANKVQLKKTKKMSKIGKFLRNGILIYLILCIVVRTILVSSGAFLEANPSPSMQILYPIFHLFGPLIGLELLSVSWWGLMVTPSYDNVSLLAVFWLPTLLITFLGLQSSWAVIQQKKWLSFRTVIVIYTLSLFITGSKGVIKEYEFKVPAVNISQNFEKQLVGPFYSMLKYFNVSEGHLFKYQVNFEDLEGNNGEFKSGGFIIKNNTGHYAYIPYNTLEEGEPTIFYNSFETKVPTKKNLPEYYECDRKDLNNCNLHNFVTQHITQTYNTIVSDAAFSPDGKWGLVVLPSGAYNPEEVYLVNLTSLIDEK